MELAMSQDRNLRYFSKPALKLPEFERYTTLVSGYTARALTMTLDISRVFKGIKASLGYDYEDLPFSTD
jgi:hypothetical protein